MTNWIAKAQHAIDTDAAIIYDVAADCGQIVDNVKHMRWFVRAVADELSGEQSCELCGEPAGEGGAVCPACVANHGL